MMIPELNKDKTKKMIHITDHVYELGGLEEDVLTILRSDIDSLNVEFIPSSEDEFYIKHPLDKDVYISMNHYFDVILTEVVEELRYVTECLDGIDVNISLYEREKTFVQTNHKPEEILVEVLEDDTYIQDFKRVRPYLRYFDHDDHLRNIIDICLENDDISGYEHVVELKDVVIKKKYARLIDEILEDMEWNGNTSFVSGVESFSRMYLVYSVKL